MAMECPSRDSLQMLLREMLPDHDRARIESHVETCRSCQMALSELVSGESTEIFVPTLARREEADADLDFLRRLKENPPPEFRTPTQKAQRGATDPEEEDEWPTELGRYRLVRKLAHGGMGVVFLARDLKFDRSVAIKFMKRALIDDKDYLEQFQNETQLMGRLQHPGIPSVHDYGVLPDGRPFFAMKLVKGQTVTELLERQKSTNSNSRDGSSPNLPYSSVAENRPDKRPRQSPPRRHHETAPRNSTCMRFA